MARKKTVTAIERLHRHRLRMGVLGCSGVVALVVSVLLAYQGGQLAALLGCAFFAIAAFASTGATEREVEIILSEFPYEPTAESAAFSLEALQFGSKKIRERATDVLLRILPMLDAEERAFLNSRHRTTLRTMLVLAKEERRRYDPRIVAAVLELLEVPLNTATSAFVNELTGRRLDPLIRQAAQRARERSREAVLKREESARLLRPSAPAGAESELLRPTGSSVRHPEEQLLHVTNDL